MELRKLGNSGLLVTELSLVAMLFGNKKERGTPDDVSEQIIYQYLEAGGNFIDTANVYVDGRSEEIIGETLKERRDEVILATKVRFRRGEGPNDIGLSRRHILQEVEKIFADFRPTILICIILICGILLFLLKRQCVLLMIL